VVVDEEKSRAVVLGDATSSVVLVGRTESETVFPADENKLELLEITRSDEEIVATVEICAPEVPKAEVSDKVAVAEDNGARAAPMMPRFSCLVVCPSFR